MNHQLQEESPAQEEGTELGVEEIKELLVRPSLCASYKMNYKLQEEGPAQDEWAVLGRTSQRSTPTWL